MVKLLSILIIGLIFESTGVVSLKIGITQIGDMKEVSVAELVKVVKAGATNVSMLLGVFCEAVFFASLLILMAKSDISFLSGNLGGWQPARALMLLHVLTGSVGTEGGHNLNAWNKFVPKTFKVPPPQKRWNELLYPQEWPLSM